MADSDYTITLDDDPDIHKLIGQILGLKSLPFATAAGLLKVAGQYRPLAAFIDVHLGPAESGLDVVPELRQVWRDVPLIVITGDEAPETVVQALSTGADDFVRKPLRAAELRARFQLRRHEAVARRGEREMRLGPVLFDIEHHSLHVGDRISYLSPSEANLLHHLAQTPGVLVERDALKGRLWGRVTVSDGALDRKLHAVRKALADVSDAVTIKTIYRKGFQLNIDA